MQNEAVPLACYGAMLATSTGKSHPMPKDPKYILFSLLEASPSPLLSSTSPKTAQVRAFPLQIRSTTQGFSPAQHLGPTSGHVMLSLPT